MKTIQVLLVAIACAAADDEWKIDWSKVKARQDAPGFWDSRWLKPRMVSRTGSISSDGNNRIVGGWEVERNYHPYQAGLLLFMGNSIFLCGGSVLQTRIILTAAHCMEDIDRTQVILGAHYLQDSTETTQQRFMVEKNMNRCHANYNPRLLINDLCILILSEDIIFTAYVQPIALPSSNELRMRSFVGERATLSGWGRTTDQSWAISPVLRAVSNFVISNDECRAIYGSMIMDSTLCMRNFGEASCHGDSGGPLTLHLNPEDDNGQAETHVIIGVVSFGSATGCSVQQPDGYARITYFINWINFIIAMG